MISDPIPWKRPAVLVKNGSEGERRIAGEGSLYAMVHRLARMECRSWEEYRICLPDRAVAPFGYEPEDFDALTRAMGRARP